MISFLFLLLVVEYFPPCSFLVQNHLLDNAEAFAIRVDEVFLAIQITSETDRFLDLNKIIQILFKLCAIFFYTPFFIH